MTTPLSEYYEYLQWDILNALAEVHPRSLTKAEFSQEFGDVADNEMMINLFRMIEDGLIQPRAIIVSDKGAGMNIDLLLLTPIGYQIATRNN